MPIEAVQDMVTGSHLGIVAEVIKGLRENQHGKLLIVGVRGDNFPPEYHEHPQLIFWATEDVFQRPIPQAVRCVVITRFISHEAFKKLRNECTRRDIPLGTRYIGTGAIKTLIAPLMADLRRTQAEPQPSPAPKASDHTPVQPEPEPQPQQEQHKEPSMTPTASVSHANGKQPMGAVRKFALAHGDLSARPFRIEAERLMKIAGQYGIHTTVLSLTKILQLESRTSNIGPRKMVKDRKVVPESAATIPEPPKVVSPHALPQLDELAHDDRELLRMIDDIGASIALIREALVSRGKRRAELKALLKDL